MVTQNEQDEGTPSAATPGVKGVEPPQYSSMKMTQLKDELRKRGLKVSGKKAELIARLHKADSEGENDVRDAHSSTAETNSYSDPYASMKVVQLKEELKKRNLKVSGTKAELIDRLRNPKPEDAAGFRKGSGKKKVEKWLDSDARRILHDILVEGKDQDGNKVELQSGPGQYPRDILKLVENLEEFQKGNFADLGAFRNRLSSLRKIVADKKFYARRDLILLQNTLKNYTVPKLDHRGKRQFVDVALPLLRVDMDAGKHLKSAPRELHVTRPEYLEHDLDVFRKHIHQEVYTRKACTQYKWKGSRHGDDLGVDFKQGIIELGEDDSECEEEECLHQEEEPKDEEDKTAEDEDGVKESED